MFKMKTNLIYLFANDYHAIYRNGTNSKFFRSKLGFLDANFFFTKLHNLFISAKGLGPYCISTLIFSVISLA